MDKPVTDRIAFYLTPEHECSYYPERTARSVFADPRARPDLNAQTLLAQHGFRRSGNFLYKPECGHCQACVPVRIPVADFTPARSQRRNLKMNADLDTCIMPAWNNEELLELYNRYQHWRHPEGHMIATGPAHYADFVLSNWSDLRYLEISQQGRLVGVTVIDRLLNGLSAVYTFYDPGYAGRGLGIFAILKLLEFAAADSLDYVYLGFWLPDHPKMDYKRRFSPLECLIDGEWRPNATAQVAQREAIRQNSRPSSVTE